MANAFYDKGKQNLVAGALNWSSDTIRVVFIDEDDDAVNLSSDDALADIASAARVHITASGGLASKTNSDGAVDAADYVASSVAGDQFESITLFTYHASEASAFLWVNLDTGTGLPCTPNSGDITVQWHSSGIFTI